ncbi:MAG: hypothetical protein GXO78_09245 [Calditrichaeota bacterium]|nr:hypothetical protein [Calditrichota bacterium]
MSTYLIAILIGIFSSLIASFTFIFFLARLRPRIEISSKIAKRIGENQNPEYRIKIINRTPRSIINIKAQLHLMAPVSTPGGIIMTSKEIKLKRDEIMEISRFNKKDPLAGYAFRFVTFENIDEIWQDDTHFFLRFRIHATDSFSGFSRVFVKDYHKKRSSIKEGEFEFGNSLNPDYALEN